MMCLRAVMVLLGLASVTAFSISNDREQVLDTKRAVDVIDESGETTQRHPDQLEVLVRREDGDDMRLRLRRGDKIPISVETDTGIKDVDLGEDDEDAFYNVDGNKGSLLVTSVEQAPGIFSRSLSGSFVHDNQAFIIDAPETAEKRFDVLEADHRRDLNGENNKHKLLKRFDLPTESRFPGGGVSLEKRSSQNLGVEIYIVLDYTVFNHYNTEARGDQTTALRNMRRYFAHVINGVDIRYSNIKMSEFAIYVRATGLHVIESRSQSFTEYSSVRNPGISDPNWINADFTLNALKDWDKSRGFLRKSDHVMAFTRKNLYSVKGGQAKPDTAGIATVKAVCRPSAYSVVEDMAKFSSEGVAAHELGHSLGAADHDGSKTASSCPAEDKYIMAPSTSNSVGPNNYRNPYLFSSCSINQIRTYILSLGSNNCLTSRATSLPNWERPSEEMPGQLLDAVGQCKKEQGETSFPCPFKQELADICRGLSCVSNAQATSCSTGRLAARGTSCGNKKWCQEGSCVYDSRAPSMDESCPFGDRATGYKGQQCSILIQREPHKCYQLDIRQACCGSCKKIKQNKPGCEYGDHEAFCSSLSRSACQTAWNNWFCSCSKCAGVAISGCEDNPYMLWGNPGKKCNAFITASTKGNCYLNGGQVAQSCCGSCRRFVDSGNPGCLFGDNSGYNFSLGSRSFTCSDLKRDPSFRQQACTQHGSAATHCCETCKGV